MRDMSNDNSRNEIVPCVEGVIDLIKNYDTPVVFRTATLTSVAQPAPVFSAGRGIRSLPTRIYAQSSICQSKLADMRHDELVDHNYGSNHNLRSAYIHPCTFRPDAITDGGTLLSVIRLPKGMAPNSKEMRDIVLSVGRNKHRLTSLIVTAPDNHPDRYLQLNTTEHDAWALFYIGDNTYVAEDFSSRVGDVSVFTDSHTYRQRFNMRMRARVLRTNLRTMGLTPWARFVMVKIKKDQPNTELLIEQMKSAAISSLLASLTIRRDASMQAIEHRIVRPLIKSGSRFNVYDEDIIVGGSSYISSIVDAAARQNTFLKYRGSRGSRKRSYSILESVHLGQARTDGYNNNRDHMAPVYSLLHYFGGDFSYLISQPNSHRYSGALHYVMHKSSSAMEPHISRYPGMIKSIISELDYAFDASTFLSYEDWSSESDAIRFLSSFVAKRRDYHYTDDNVFGDDRVPHRPSIEVPLLHFAAYDDIVKTGKSAKLDRIVQSNSIEQLSQMDDSRLSMLITESIYNRVMVMSADMRNRGTYTEHIDHAAQFLDFIRMSSQDIRKKYDYESKMIRLNARIF